MVYFIFFKYKDLKPLGQNENFKTCQSWSVNTVSCYVTSTIQSPVVTTQAFPHLTPGQCRTQAPLGLGTLSPFGPKAIWQSHGMECLISLGSKLCDAECGPVPSSLSDLYSLPKDIQPMISMPPTCWIPQHFSLYQTASPEVSPEVQVCMSCPLRGQEASHTDGLHLTRALSFYPISISLSPHLLPFFSFIFMLRRSLNKKGERVLRLTTQHLDSRFYHSCIICICFIFFISIFKIH